MDSSDILNMMEEKPVATTSTYSNNGKPGGNKRYDPSQDNNLKPIIIDPNTLVSDRLLFSVGTYSNTDDVGNDIIDTFVKVATALSNKGYTFVHTGSSDNVLQNKILKIEGIKSETYIPWKKFNEDIEEPYLARPTDLAFSIGAHYHSAFMKMKPAIKTILARTVNALLGKACKEPITLFLAYSDCGSESIGKNVDFKKLGNLVFIFKLCFASNIPVFNLKNPAATSKLVEFIKSKAV